MLLQQYLRSIEVRDETKLSLLLGFILGTVSIVLISIYPGKPIDYSGVGELICIAHNHQLARHEIHRFPFII